MGDSDRARACAFGVGCAKSGTHSLAKMFEGSVRAAHEPKATAFLRLVQRRHAGELREEDFGDAVAALLESLDLEINVSQINGFVVDTLFRLYPTARYVLTLRDGRSWLQSFVNHTINIRRGAGGVWKTFRDIRCEPAKHPHRAEDAPLRAARLYSLDAYLSYWVRHNARVVDTIPAEQLLIVPTARITDQADRIAAFLGLPASAVDREKSHDFAGKYVRTPVDRLDGDYLRDRLDFYTQDLLNAVRPRLTETAFAAFADAIETPLDVAVPPAEELRPRTRFDLGWLSLRAGGR
jgi:hypothetical protein